MRLMVAMSICAAAAFASGAAATPTGSAALPPGCATVQEHEGNTTGDWEAVFGRRKLMRRARALLRLVHQRGFRCALIENEQHTHEVAVIGLHTRAAARKIVRRARLKRLVGCHILNGCLKPRPMQS